MFLNLYKSTTRPHFEYAAPVWQVTRKIKKVTENVQRRATKLVSTCKNTIQREIIQTWTSHIKIQKDDPDMYTKCAYYSRQLSIVLQLQKTRSILNVRGNTFSNRVVDTWNNLLESVVNPPSVNTFKTILNKHWHGHPTRFNATCYQTCQPTRGIRTEYYEASLQVR